MPIACQRHRLEETESELCAKIIVARETDLQPAISELKSAPEKTCCREPRQPTEADRERFGLATSYLGYPPFRQACFAGALRTRLRLFWSANTVASMRPRLSGGSLRRGSLEDCLERFGGHPWSRSRRQESAIGETFTRQGKVQLQSVAFPSRPRSMRDRRCSWYTVAGIQSCDKYGATNRVHRWILRICAGFGKKDRTETKKIVLLPWVSVEGP